MWIYQVYKIVLIYDPCIKLDEKTIDINMIIWKNVKKIISALCT